MEIIKDMVVINHMIEIIMAEEIEDMDKDQIMVIEDEVDGEAVDIIIVDLIVVVIIMVLVVIEVEGEEVDLGVVEEEVVEAEVRQEMKALEE